MRDGAADNGGSIRHSPRSLLQPLRTGNRATSCSAAQLAPDMGHCGICARRLHQLSGFAASFSKYASIWDLPTSKTLVCARPAPTHPSEHIRAFVKSPKREALAFTLRA
jgi:hypothetical protein